MVSEKQKKINDKIAHRVRRAAMEEAKRAEEREKNAEAMRASRVLLTEKQIQDAQAVDTKKHLVIYTALDPTQLQQINSERAVAKTIREKKLKIGTS